MNFNCIILVTNYSIFNAIDYVYTNINCTKASMTKLIPLERVEEIPFIGELHLDVLHCTQLDLTGLTAKE